MQTEIIKPTAQIQVNVSAERLNYLQETITFLVQNKDAEVKALIGKLDNNEALEDPWDISVATLLSLVADIEDAARNQGLTEMVNVPAHS